MTYELLLNRIDEKIPNFCTDAIKKHSQKKMYLTEYQQDTILSVVSHFVDKKHKNIAQDLLKDIISDSKGKLFELMIYGWLIEKYIDFIPQVEISKHNCFKDNNYYADGQLNKNNPVYFDIKQFGIGSTHIETAQNKLQVRFPKHIVSIAGNLNNATSEIEANLLQKLDDIAQSLQDSIDNRGFPSYVIKDGINIEIRLTPKTERMAISVSEMDMTEWAMNNKFYFMKHGSQFCINDPYIIFCPFDKSIHHHLPLNNDNYSTNLQLRFLARRIFIELSTLNNRYLHEFDGKSKNGISISAASRKISAIVFLDVESKWEYHNCRNWVFINPNADNPLYGYQVNSWFRNNGAHIDDFRFDNY